MRLKSVALSLTVLSLLALTIPTAFACGKVTGGGHCIIVRARGANGIPGGSFGFNVMHFSRDPGPKGELNYVDHTTGMHVHAHDIDFLTVWETNTGRNQPWPRRQAHFGGPCTVDGVDGYRFEVFVVDEGEPGENDRFLIRVFDSGGGVYYEGGSRAELILCGNIQTHKPPK